MADGNAKPNRPKSKTVKGSLILIGFCGAVAILGIFIGIIVVYGGINALWPD
ncbi:hypothetical protein ACFSE1_17765 [Rhizobium helianthi]|uniref:Uncharacterized protein n=1 Tax=Rhizobium helianthi TaxID=1132695 RepID=A0ABW4M791_9HYPH